MNFKFEDLKVWDKSVDFAVDIYQTTKGFPREELYGITAQLRSTALSISSNIAEGEGRFHDKDFQRFIRIARGSTNEVVSLLVVSQKIGLLSQERFDDYYNRAHEIAKMLHGLKRSLDKGLPNH